MFENKFVLLAVNFVWMVGLFGALLSLIYMAQYRRKYWWKIGDTYNVPHAQFPLSCALLIFCLGLTLQAYAAQRAISLWVALAWGLLMLFFLFRSFEVLFAGLQNGWDQPMTTQPATAGQGQRLPIWTSSVITLLVANILLLGWWGSAHLNASGVALPWVQQSQQTAERVIPTTFQQPFPLNQTNSEQQLWPRASVTASQVVITPTLIPAVSTLDATTLEVTPTPLNAAEKPTLVLNALPVLTPTIEIVLKPTATSLATATVDLTPFIVVQSITGANVRMAPELTADVITLLPDAAVATVLGRTADHHWYSIRLPDGAQGWIADETVKLNGAPELVPLVIN